MQAFTRNFQIEINLVAGILTNRESEVFIDFSREQLRKLPVDQKKEHSLVNFRACTIMHNTELAYYGSQLKSAALKGIANANPVFIAQN